MPWPTRTCGTAWCRSDGTAEQRTPNVQRPTFNARAPVACSALDVLRPRSNASTLSRHGLNLVGDPDQPLDQRLRTRTHKRCSMYKGQKEGQKGPIRAQFRQKTQKKSKKAPDSALPMLTFRSPNPPGASARPDSASRIGQNPPNSTQNCPPTYRRCAMCVHRTPTGGAP